MRTFSRPRKNSLIRLSCHHHILQTYLLTSTSSSTELFAEGLQFRQRYARTSSDCFFLPLVTAVDHGALPWSTLKNASISEPRACARQGHCPMRSASVLPARVDRPAEELSASCYGSPLEPCALPNRATSHFQIVAIYHFQIVLLPNCIIPNCI